MEVESFFFSSTETLPTVATQVSLAKANVSTVSCLILSGPLDSHYKTFGLFFHVGACRTKHWFVFNKSNRLFWHISSRGLGVPL